MDALLKALAENPIALVAFGLGSAMLFAVRKWGLLVGERGAPADRNAAQVAAVIVDPTALNSARDAVTDLTKTIHDGQTIEKDHVHMICRRLEALTDGMEDMTRGLAELRVELARRR